MFILIDNQNKIIKNQEEVGLPTVINTNERIKNIEEKLSNGENLTALPVPG